MDFYLPYDKADAILQGMTLEQKVGQMVVASVEVTHLDDKTRRFLKDNMVGNIILFGKNCVDRAQIAQLDAQLQEEIAANTGVQALISIDQEGGPVTRIRNGATVFPCAMAIGSTGDAENAFLTGCIMGNEMRELGIYFDLAPVLDINFDNNDPIVGRRSYGETPEETALFGAAMARGLRAAGIIDCGKHFPGHGHSRKDTHFDFDVQDATREQIMRENIVPFRRAMGDGMRAIMTSHICYPALDPECVPNTMSKRVLRDFVRDELGFEGLVISDGMQMLAIADHYGAPEGCVRAAEAGCDLLIVGNGGDNADPDGLDVQTPCIRAMVEAAKRGELSMERVNESARRILAFKLALGDMRPTAQAATRDWRAHEAFAKALASMSVTVHRDTLHMLPLKAGALFLSGKSKARLGVEEGDRLVDGFASLAARLLNGTAIEFDGVPDLDAMKRAVIDAPAVVVGVTSKRECETLVPMMKEILSVNERLCVVCLDAPHVLSLVPFVPCAVSSYDQTATAIRAVCQALDSKG